MNKAHEAELLLREGLKALPDHPALQFMPGPEGVAQRIKELQEKLAASAPR